MKNSITTCMITKNEENHLGKALQSIAALSSEIIVVDTGSTDKTIHIAQDFGAKIFNFSWNNNFSDARNFSLKQATSDWIFVLDADETINTADIPKFKDNLIQNTAYSFTTRNYLHLNTIPGCIKAKGEYPAEEKGFFGWIESPKVRLFPNNPQIVFQNIVHEIVEPSILTLNIPIQKMPIPIHHFGFEKDEKSQLEKSTMHLALLKKQIIQSPDNAKCYFDIGFILFNKKDYTEAIVYFNDALKKNARYTDALFYLSQCFIELNQIETAKETLSKLLSIAPEFSEAHYLLGNISFNKHRFLDALRSYQIVLKTNPNHPEVYFKMGSIYEKMGDLGKAKSSFKKAKSILE